MQWAATRAMQHLECEVFLAWGSFTSTQKAPLPQQLPLGVPGHASQQQFLLPVHEFVGEAVAASTQLLSHIGSLEGEGRGLIFKASLQVSRACRNDVCHRAQQASSVGNYSPEPLPTL